MLDTSCMCIDTAQRAQGIPRNITSATRKCDVGAGETKAVE